MQAHTSADNDVLQPDDDVVDGLARLAQPVAMTTAHINNNNNNDNSNNYNGTLTVTTTDATALACGDDSKAAQVQASTRYLLPAAAPSPPRPLPPPPTQVLMLPPPPRKRVLGRFRRVGCLICAFDAWHAVFVALPIVADTALFLSSVIVHTEAYSYAIAGVLALAALLCLLLAVGVDPGIVPPAPASCAPPPSAPAVAVLVRGTAVVCKVCPTCHVLRPPRSSHCRFCDVCVEEFDHHCRVVGSCVGRRTLRFFSGFLLFSAVLALYILVRTIVVLVTLDLTATYATAGGRWRIAACALCIAISVIGCPFVAPCALQYIYFACLDLTQKELMRTRRPFALNRPYHRGFCRNVLHRFCAPLGPSRVQGDEYV